MKQYGIIFDTGSPIRGILTNDSIDQLANDAAMVTAANSGVPVEFTSYIDPMVIPILTATRGAREIFGEAKKGDWTTSYARFQAIEKSTSQAARVCNWQPINNVLLLL